MRERLKKLVFRLLGKEPEAVVVTFLSGDPALAQKMADEVRELIPGRRRFDVGLEEESAWTLYRRLRRLLRRYRIGMVPVLFTADPRYAPMRRAAFLLAPGKILAYNARLERHHLKLSHPIASWLFLRGVPLDRIFLRPRWLWAWKKDRSVYPAGCRVAEGRPPSPGRPRVGVLTPYFPYPLSHGGAVRIFHLLREMAREFDVFLFAFGENGAQADLQPLLEFCARVTLVEKPRYREPRWSTLSPPEVAEYRSPRMASLVAQARAENQIDLLQVEYTSLASYGGDILVEHDVTFDLYRQVLARRHSLAAWWNWWRWRRFERNALRGFRRIVVMSAKDQALLGGTHARIIPNGVDLERFRPQPETAGRRLLFIGSFRHFPNVLAARFLTGEVWPELRRRVPEASLTIVAGPDPWLHWREQTGTAAPFSDDRIRWLEFVADVRPLYVDANVVVVPTLVSAGTNLKVIEALAMERAVVSTTSGCAGLGLEHGVNVLIAGSAADFAGQIVRLLGDQQFRRTLAAAGRKHAEANFDWRAIGERQRDLVREMVPDGIVLRAASEADLERIAEIQAAAPEASQWPPASYLSYECRVAETDGRVVGFLASRSTGPGEREILNVAVEPEFRRRGVARRLLELELAQRASVYFLEVRPSNIGARKLYEKLGFREEGRRKGYYRQPPEDAIVMRFFS